ncbi:MAG: hypothetical protein ABEN55_04170, partial [Bradymonadaceae bacterium]
MTIRQALIPAAGRGARLDGHVGLLAGVVVGYEGDQIVRELTNHPKLELELEFIDHDGWKQGLASSVRQADGQLDSPFVLAMADHWFDQDLVDRAVERDLDDDAVLELIDPDVDDVYDVDSAVKVRAVEDRAEEVGFELADYNAVDAGLFVASNGLFDACKDAMRETEPAGLADVLGKLAANARVFDLEEGSDSFEYEFTTGKPVTTDIVVQRGLVRNPSEVKLIPDESASSPIYVFTDERVNRIYGDDFVGGLRDLGY